MVTSRWQRARLRWTRAVTTFLGRLAQLWGLLHGGHLEVVDGLRVCWGMRRGYARGGTTIGDTYLTGRRPGPEVVSHEKVHVEQWRRYGLSFALRYAAAGRDPLRNRWEREAGLEAGGYLSTGSPGHAS